MNAIFLIFCGGSLTYLLITAPEKALPAMLSGAEKAITLTITLAAVYTVWLGVYKLLDLSGACDRFALLLKKPVRALFGNIDKSAEKIIALNLSANVLGVGGIATPLGIEACALLEKTNCRSAAELLLIISATSVQIIPSTVMALAAGFGSKNPASIFLPSLLSTFLSTALGILLFKLFTRK